MDWAAPTATDGKDCAEEGLNVHEEEGRPDEDAARLLEMQLERARDDDELAVRASHCSEPRLANS